MLFGMLPATHGGSQGERETMSAALRFTSCQPEEKRAATLLELVSAICETTEDDQEVVSTVLHLLETGRVRLSGTFRGRPVDDLR